MDHHVDFFYMNSPVHGDVKPAFGRGCNSSTVPFYMIPAPSCQSPDLPDCALIGFDHQDESVGPSPN